MKVHLITGTYSLLSEKCVTSVKERLDIGDSVILGVATGPSAANHSSTTELCVIVNEVYKHLFHASCSRKKLVVEGFIIPNSVNMVQFSKEFYEHFKMSDEELKLCTESIMLFLEDAIRDMPEYFLKINRDVDFGNQVANKLNNFLMSWAMLNSFADVADSMKTVDMSRSLTWWDFSEEDRKDWSMCADCMPRSKDNLNTECVLCSDTGIDTSSPGYNGPGLELLLAGSEKKAVSHEGS